MKSSLENEHICPKWIYCDFFTTLENEEVLKEMCINCGKTLIFNKIDGKIDDKRYSRAHFRDILQPFGRHHDEFVKIYGQKSLKRAKEIGAQQAHSQGLEGRKKDIMAEFNKEKKISSKTFF